MLSVKILTIDSQGDIRRTIQIATNSALLDDGQLTTFKLPLLPISSVLFLSTSTHPIPISPFLLSPFPLLNEPSVKNSSSLDLEFCISFKLLFNTSLMFF
jgi:hypothetical protein